MRRNKVYNRGYTYIIVTFYQLYIAIMSNLYTIEKLDATNYHTWKFKMRMILIEKDLWDIVETPSESEAGLKKSKKALALISLSVSDSELVYLTESMTAAAAWAKLSGT